MRNLIASIYCLLLFSIASDVYAQYRNPEVPVPDLRTATRYGHLLDRVGTYDYASILNDPALSARLRDITGPYYSRVMEIGAKPSPISAYSESLVLHASSRSDPDEVILITVNWYFGGVCAGLYRSDWVRLFCPRMYFREIPQPLKIRARSNRVSNLLKEEPQGIDFEFFNTTRETWLDIEKRLGPSELDGKIRR